MQQQSRITLSASLLIGAALFLGACSSSPTKSLDTATASVADLRAQLDNGEKQVDAVIESLRGFRPPAAEEADQPYDLEEAFSRYRSELARLEKAADRARARRAAMRVRMNDHLEKWQTELENISSEQAKQISAQRREQLAAVLEQLAGMLDELKADYQPFLSNLKDIELVLANDLSTGGLAVTEPLIADAATQAAEVKQSIANTEQSLAQAIAAFER